MPTSTRSEYRLFEIDAGEGVHSVTFTPNGEYLVSSGEKDVRVWRVADGKQARAMKVESGGVASVSVSRDGRWIAAGSWTDIVVWDATTYEQVFAHRSKSSNVASVDFSPDSTHLVCADRCHRIATIWDIAAHRKVLALSHNSDRQWILAAKYSPEGDRIATATSESVRVWDSSDGSLLVDVKAPVNELRDLFWLKNCLFLQANDGTIKQINAATGSTVLEWPVSRANAIALGPQHGKFVAYTAEKNIFFLDSATHSQINLISHAHDISSIACSSDGRLLAIAAERKIVVRDLSSIIFSFAEPALYIGSAALSALKQGQLVHAEALLSAAIQASKGTPHHALASRALVRARLGQWDVALIDAKESIKIQRSVIGFVAKCVILVGKGDTRAGCRLCDIAFHHFHPKHVPLFLLIKAVVLFMTGEHADAMSRMDDLITDVWPDPALYVVQAYMHLLCGDLHMKNRKYKLAIQSFEDARIKLGNRTRQPPLMVSLISGWRFDNLAITIQEHLCEALLAADRTKEASESILRMADDETNMTEPIKAWVSDFKRRCRSKSDDLGNGAANAKQHDEAVSQYTVALSLDPASPGDLLVKRSKAYAEKGELENALNDANEAIRLNPSSPLSHETKYAALLGMGHHDDAIDAFETMLSKMSDSCDPEIRERSRHFIRPERTKEAIHNSIKNAIRDSPLVLIDTSSGRLCNKSEQAATFESKPDFTRLLTSMTTRINHPLIEEVVGKFYRYATFSHTWEGNEPLYDKVVKIVVYDLKASPTHEKLKMFCKIVRDAGFNWAWSDTCCIDKKDPSVLQESLFSMFKWYEGSTMTVIFLYDVDELAEPGALTTSIWNSRTWTLQEYHASKVVRIYTKNWTPYLGLTIHNHKESPKIISEMEKATGISADALVALRPGLSDIRTKLRLASTRQTTRVEDAAYSLLGIFSMSLPITYGEGDKALGRLLSQLLTSSGDTSILAWSGRSGSFNSCLPNNIAVFSQPLTSHIPPTIADAEMRAITDALRASSLDLDLATRLYDRVNGLRTPTVAGQRMRLPCLTFRTRLISLLRDGSEFVYRAQAGALGIVEIKTYQNLRQLDCLHLIHPWIDFLLDRHPVRNAIETMPNEHEYSVRGELPSLPDHSSASNPLDAPLSTALPMDNQTRTYQFLARLRRPFGALLLTPTRRNVEEYRRVASESLITVQVGAITSAMLDELTHGVRMLDVL